LKPLLIANCNGFNNEMESSLNEEGCVLQIQLKAILIIMKTQSWVQRLY